jgi:hypothetical protein
MPSMQAKMVSYPPFMRLQASICLLRISDKEGRSNETLHNHGLLIILITMGQGGTLIEGQKLKAEVEFSQFPQDFLGISHWDRREMRDVIRHWGVKTELKFLNGTGKQSFDLFMPAN